MSDDVQELIAQALTAQERARPEAERTAARAAVKALQLRMGVDGKALASEPLWLSTLDSLLALQPAFTEPSLQAPEAALLDASREKHHALLRRLIALARTP